MPTVAQVKVNTIGSTVRGNSNMVELTGYDHTNRRGFKKLFFETKKDGGLTKNAETAQSLKQDDWVEITMDDTSYKNVQSIRRISQPADGDVPSQSEGSPAASTGAGGGGDAPASNRMSKAEWAAKDAHKELGVARSVALKAAVAAVSSDGKGFTKAKMTQIEKMIDGFTSFLLYGDFKGKPVVEASVVQQDAPVELPADAAPEEQPPVNDDIPF